MKKCLFIFLFIVPSLAFSQSDTLNSGFFGWEDSIWTHSINECDLILQLHITSTFYVSDGGSFMGKVMKVEKGKFKERNVSWTMGMIEDSRERWNGRYKAIYPEDWKKPYKVFAGFMKTKSDYPDLYDKSTRQGYDFFMSVEKFPN
jgi:hypothetical protein